MSPCPPGAGSRVTLTPAQLELRRRIFLVFAATGRPPATLDPGDGALLRSLAEHHVVVLDAGDGILMAHPFAAHRDGARVDADHVAVPARRWWEDIAFT